MHNPGNEIHCKEDRSRRHLAVILALTLIAVAGWTASTAYAQEEPTVAHENDGDRAKSRVLGIPKGSYVEVQMADGREIEGLLGDVVADGFMLQTVRKNRLATRKVRFDEMQSVTPQGRQSSRNGNVELTLDHGNLVVGVDTHGVNIDLVFRTPPKIAKNLAAHVTVRPKK